jgi:hypothetical protein
MRRSFLQRVQDVTFRLCRERLRSKAPKVEKGDLSEGSVSGGHDWVALASRVVANQWPDSSIRRHPAVFDIVETVGPTDGRHYARFLQREAPQLLAGEAFQQVDCWGRPMRWPGWCLGTRQAFSPTSLRYLATACWLAQRGLLADRQPIVEIGVGFGGLAACNHLVSDSTTTLVDLPAVEKLAAKMVRATRSVDFPCASDTSSSPENFCLISNYAFTELSSEWQDRYLDQWVRHASSGLIVSNAEVFAAGIGGRDDSELIRRLRDFGLNPERVTEDPLLAPTDHHYGVSLIYWGSRG